MPKLILTAILLLVSGCTIIGRPEGGHKNACLTLIPEHIHLQGQRSRLPYKLYVDEKRPYVDQKLTFTIFSKYNKTLIAGFMVQAREVEFMSSPLGKFVPQGPVQVINCLGGLNNTATHTEPSPKNNVTMVWYPPPGFKGRFRFYATVAKSREEFWVAAPSRIIEYIDMPV